MSADQQVSPDEPIKPEALRALARHHRTMGFPYSAQLIDKAASELDRLHELIRRALADGMGVLDEPDYDLYGELSTYLGGAQ